MRCLRRSHNVNEQKVFHDRAISTGASYILVENCVWQYGVPCHRFDMVPIDLGVDGNSDRTRGRQDVDGIAAGRTIVDSAGIVRRDTRATGGDPRTNPARLTEGVGRSSGRRLVVGSIRRRGFSGLVGRLAVVPGIVAADSWVGSRDRGRTLAVRCRTSRFSRRPDGATSCRPSWLARSAR